MLKRTSLAVSLITSLFVACGGDDAVCPSCPIAAGAGGTGTDDGMGDGGAPSGPGVGEGGAGGSDTTCTPTALSWQATTPLPASVGLAEAVVVNGTLYVLGGVTPTPGMNTTAVYAAPIGADGTLGSWTEQASLPYADGLQSATTDGTRIFVTGSNLLAQDAGSTAPDGFVYFADASAGGVSAWTEGMGEEPFPLFGHGSFVFGERLYVVGGITVTTGIGANPTSSSSVTSTGLFGDGSIGNWSIHQESLPEPAIITDVALVGDRVHVVGGSTSPTQDTPGDGNQVATVLPGGGTSSWSDGVALPAPRMFHAVTPLGDRILVAGGVETNTMGETPQSTTWVLGPGASQWEVDTPLPTGRAGMAAAANDKFVFLVGGGSGGTDVVEEVLVSAHCE